MRFKFVFHVALIFNIALVIGILYFFINNIYTTPVTDLNEDTTTNINTENDQSTSTPSSVDPKLNNTNSLQTEGRYINDNNDNKRKGTTSEDEDESNEVQSNPDSTEDPVDSSPPEVTTTVPTRRGGSSNYLSLKSRATPGDRGEGNHVTSGGTPVADLREAKGEVNRRGRLQDKVVTSGGMDNRNVTSGVDEGITRVVANDTKAYNYRSVDIFTCEKVYLIEWLDKRNKRVITIDFKYLLDSYDNNGIKIKVQSGNVRGTPYKYYKHELNKPAITHLLKIDNKFVDKKPHKSVLSLILYKYDDLPLILLLILDDLIYNHNYYYYDNNTNRWEKYDGTIKLTDGELVGRLNNLNSKNGDVINFDLENYNKLDHGYTDNKIKNILNISEFLYIPTDGLNIKNPKSFNIHSISYNNHYIDGINLPIYNITYLIIYSYIPTPSSIPSIPLLICIYNNINKIAPYTYYMYCGDYNWKLYSSGDKLSRNIIESILRVAYKKYGFNNKTDFDVCKIENYTLNNKNIKVIKDKYDHTSLELHQIYDRYIHDVQSTTKLGNLLCNGNKLDIPQIYNGIIGIIIAYLNDEGYPMIIEIETERGHVIYFFNPPNNWERVDKGWKK